MRAWLICAAVAAALAAGATVAGGGTSAAAESAVVGSVTDGDTLVLADGRRVRLLQIDAPEPGTGECYSRASRRALVALAPPGARVGLEADPRLDRVDAYDRLLRYVRRGSVNVNLELVRRGAAAPYFYRGERGRYAGVLLAAARQARAQKRGLWGACPRTPLDPERQVDTGRSGGGASGGASSGGKCAPSYPTVCIPPPPPDLDCGEIDHTDFRVRHDVADPDPHGFDGNEDGVGCES